MITAETVFDYKRRQNEAYKRELGIEGLENGVYVENYRSGEDFIIFGTEDVPRDEYDKISGIIDTAMGNYKVPDLFDVLGNTKRPQEPVIKQGNLTIIQCNLANDKIPGIIGDMITDGKTVTFTMDSRALHKFESAVMDLKIYEEDKGYAMNDYYSLPDFNEGKYPGNPLDIYRSELNVKSNLDYKKIANVSTPVRGEELSETVKLFGDVIWGAECSFKQHAGQYIPKSEYAEEEQIAECAYAILEGVANSPDAGCLMDDNGHFVLYGDVDLGKSGSPEDITTLSPISLVEDGTLTTKGCDNLLEITAELVVNSYNPHGTRGTIIAPDGKNLTEELNREYEEYERSDDPVPFSLGFSGEDYETNLLETDILDEDFEH